MESIVYRKLKVLPVIVFLSFFITGCNPLIIIEAGKNSAVQELYVDNYKMQVRITLLSDERISLSILTF